MVPVAGANPVGARERPVPPPMRREILPAHLVLRKKTGGSFKEMRK